MSTFRSPPDDKPPASRFGSNLESNQSTDSQRQGAFKPSAGNLDDIAPISSRFASSPLSKRSGSGTYSAARLPSPATGQAAAPAPRSSGKGGIYQITKILEKKHGAFFISRLILASGISLRGYDSESYDDPVVISKFAKTLRNILSPTDMADLFSQVPSLMNMK